MPSEILVTNIYIPDCKISLASFVLYFHLLLIGSFIRVRSFFFISWSLLQKLNMIQLFELLVKLLSFQSTEPGCNVPSGQRVLCNPDLRAPFVNPGNCTQDACCYDDMFMSEQSVNFYDASGRAWCFTKQ